MGYQAGRVLALGGRFHPHISHYSHYHSYGHSYGYGGGSGGVSGWIWVLIIVIVIAVLGFRLMRRRRRW